MRMQESKKSLEVLVGDEVVIKAVRDPITGKCHFLVENRETFRAFITSDIVIDGTKLVAT